jgi:hypothetical protein
MLPPRRKNLKKSRIKVPVCTFEYDLSRPEETSEI